jgi:hypothetical protein
MDYPLVSIVIPVYGVADYFPSTLDSALCQSYPAVEIVVSATPTAFTGKVAEITLHKGARVRHVIAKHDVNVGALLRLGCGSATGQYVAWLDQDDEMDPRRIELQMTSLRGAAAPSIATCGIRVRTIDRTGVGVDPGQDWVAAFAGPIATLKTLISRTVDFRTLLVERSLLDAAGGYTDCYRYRYAEDIALRLLPHCAVVHEPAALVRHHIPLRPDDPSIAEAERRRLWQYVLEQRPEAFTLEGLGALAFAAGADWSLSLAESRRRVAELVGAEDLEIVLLQRPSTQSDVSSIKNALGVPGAAFSVADIADRQSPDFLARGAETSIAEWIVAIDSEDFADAKQPISQLLYAVANGLAACLPCRDELTFDRSSVSSFITGTLFRRSVLREALRKGVSSEPRFWSELFRIGRVAGLPSTVVIPRPPAARPFKKPERRPASRVAALVDGDWYLSIHDDVRTEGTDPAKHYLEHGWLEYRDPNRWFSTYWYLANNPEARRTHESPLHHFVEVGARNGRAPHPAFNMRWYARRYLANAPLTPEVLSHFLYRGGAAGNMPDPRLDRAEVRSALRSLSADQRKEQILSLHAQLTPERDIVAALIDKPWYLFQRPDVARANVDPVSHYLKDGWREGRDPSPWFHSSWYLEQNPEAAECGTSPIEHYVTVGAAEGLRPCREFDPVWYSRHYLGAYSPSIEAFHHFVTTGLANGAVPEKRLNRPDLLARLRECPLQERRRLILQFRALVDVEEEAANLLVDSGWYFRRYPRALDAGIPATEHYRTRGWMEGCNPNSWFDTHWYLRQNPDLIAADICPLDHYVSVRTAEPCLPYPLPGVDNSIVPKEQPTQEPQVRKLPAAKPGGILSWKWLDVDVWRTRLTKSLPVGTPVVLVLLTADLIEATGLALGDALATGEYPLFGSIEGSAVLRLSDSIDRKAETVEFRLPDHLEELRTLLIGLRCRRAQTAEPQLQSNPVVRAIRNAGLPVFLANRG